MARPGGNLRSYRLTLMSPLKLGILDQVPLPEDGGTTQAFTNSIELARHADDFGYHRYWIAEHHASNRLASPSPEILIARLGAETRRIRVGSGGVMLSHYSPFKVAENFRMLEVMYPGRVDLGVGRAPGSDGLTMAALAYGNRLGLEYYPTKVGDLLAFLGGQPPLTDAFARLRVSPAADGMPEIWLLASSADSAGFAAQLGIPLCFAHFISPQQTLDVVRGYRSSFRPGYRDTPQVSIGIAAFCSEDPDRVELHLRQRELQRQRRATGNPKPVTLDEAASHPFSDVEIQAMRTRRSRYVIGDPDEVRQQIETLAKDTGAEEFILLTNTGQEERINSYRLIAEAFALDSATQTPN